MLTVLTIQANATTMCAINDSVPIILDPSINQNEYGYDKTTGTWWVQFPYGRISGISACLKKSSSPGRTVAGLQDTDDNGQLRTIIGSEKYGDNCWCKMTHPAFSLWTYNLYVYGGYGTCKNNCEELCAKKNYEIRQGLFGSVSN